MCQTCGTVKIKTSTFDCSLKHMGSHCRASSRGIMCLCHSAPAKTQHGVLGQSNKWSFMANHVEWIAIVQRSSNGMWVILERSSRATTGTTPGDAQTMPLTQSSLACSVDPRNYRSFLLGLMLELQKVTLATLKNLLGSRMPKLCP